MAYALTTRPYYDPEYQFYAAGNTNLLGLAYYTIENKNRPTVELRARQLFWYGSIASPIGVYQRFVQIIDELYAIAPQYEWGSVLNITCHAGTKSSVHNGQGTGFTTTVSAKLQGRADKINKEVHALLRQRTKDWQTLHFEAGCGLLLGIARGRNAEIGFAMHDLEIGRLPLKLLADLIEYTRPRTFTGVRARFGRWPLTRTGLDAALTTVEQEWWCKQPNAAAA